VHEKFVCTKRLKRPVTAIGVASGESKGQCPLQSFRK